MDGSFELGKQGFYTPKNVLEIDGFQPDQYGNKWYNVVFQGDAETHMWLKKDPPIEGQKYWGHIEPTSSGKRLRFKTDKQPDNLPQTPEQAPTKSAQQTDYEPGTNARWAIGMAYRACIQVTGSIDGASGDFPFDMVEQHASELVKMFDRVKNGVNTPIIQPQSETKGYDKFQQMKKQFGKDIATEYDESDVPNFDGE